MRGKFIRRKTPLIVFEGIDGAGSTTQTDLLFKYLKSKNHRVIKTCEPTDGPIGKLIRRALKHELKFSWQTLQLMYSADRADHLDKLILPAVNAGKIVISDRYFFSTLAYGELNLDGKWLRELCKNFPMPSVTFLIDTPVSVAMERMESSRGSKELYERKNFLDKVRKNYLKQAKEFSFYVLDGTKTKSEIAKEVLEILKKKKFI